MTKVAEHGQKSFRALVGAQFLGAFNDNLFKQLILFLAASYLFKGQDKQGLAFAVFSLPFVLFSGMAGDLSEKYSKRKIIVWMKVAEIVVMVLGMIALQMKSWTLMLVVLFIMGLQSAFFGPSKYGVIPELVPPLGLMKANGVIAMTTFMGVLLGQALAGPLLDKFIDQLWITGAACVAFSVIGLIFSLRMGELERQKPDLPITPNPFGRLFETIGHLRKQKGLMTIVVLNSFFWFDGGVIQQSIVALGEKAYLNVPAGEKRLLSLLMVTLALSIIIGSVIAPRFSKMLSAGKMTTIGFVGMIVGQGLMLLIGPVFQRANGGLYFAHFVMIVIGFFGAFFVVPTQSYLQHAPEPGMKGQTFAVNNFMNFLFIFLGGVYYMIVRNPSVGMGPTLAQGLAGVFMIIAFVVCMKQVKEMDIKEE
ncbi:MAG TPA: hypothetical protein DCE42_07960 [Myxococcales bacterium]|mgnify:CR=1 FL=1|nr:hypothetical protein [Deltaproteobacteria bacterium]MBU54184.1 hypothetical protein [Deltaproteobacteria bacterium]HAA54678.1 hypothetical protein [Myxococcales bacterium]|tara:strand:+ start:6414 stop:7676 length:1263 start_codon:yes stop_codon:yes gene_type:complete